MEIRVLSVSALKCNKHNKKKFLPNTPMSSSHSNFHLTPTPSSQENAKQLDELQSRFDHWLRREFYLQGLFEEARTLRIHASNQLRMHIVRVWPDVPCERCGAPARAHAPPPEPVPGAKDVRLRVPACASFVLENMSPIVQLLRGGGGGGAAPLKPVTAAPAAAAADVYLSANIRPNYKPAVRAPPLLQVSPHSKT